MATRRPVALRCAACVAVALLTVASCGDDDAGDATATSAATSPGGASGSTVAPEDTATSAPTAADTGITATTSATEPPTTAGPPATLEVGNVGSFAPALLRGDLSDRLVVEVHADADPRQETLDHVTDVLGAVADKPVSVVGAAPPNGGERAWTSVELVAAADAGSTTAQGGGVAVVRLLFVHGTFGGDDGVLGIAVRGDVAAVFVDRVSAAAGLLGGSGGIEASVATHELGHLLGLVDLYRHTGRADPDHPGHSTNPDSVMYWAVETDLIGQLLGADPPRDFDADDLADLAAIRSGA